MTKKKKIIGVTFSTFDLLHAGHMLMLKDAKSKCDFLIVGLQVDPSVDRNKNKPVMSLKERKILVEGNKYIDRYFTYTTEKDLYNKLKKLKYDIRIIGSDWKGKHYTGYDLPHKIYYHNRKHDYSTSGLRDRVFQAELKKKNHRR